MQILETIENLDRKRRHDRFLKLAKFPHPSTDAAAGYVFDKDGEMFGRLLETKVGDDVRVIEVFERFDLVLERADGARLSIIFSVRVGLG